MNLREPAVRMTGAMSAMARQRLLARSGEPLLITAWERALMIHFEVDAEALQRDVPYELDLRDGRAFVSLVAFTMRGMKPRVGGRFAEWLLRPIATHGFLNVRTYVRHGDETHLDTTPVSLSPPKRGEGWGEGILTCNNDASSPRPSPPSGEEREKTGAVRGRAHGDETGIHFLAEWLSNRLAVLLGPATFGLPYRHGRIEYEHAWEDGELRGRVVDGQTGLTLDYRAGSETGAPLKFAPCEAGSLDEWLMERYTAFNSAGSRRRFFRIWHPPWPQCPVEADLRNISLLTQHWRWFADARLIGANFSPGFREVWMGRPQRIS